MEESDLDRGWRDRPPPRDPTQMDPDTLLHGGLASIAETMHPDIRVMPGAITRPGVYLSHGHW